MAGHRSTAPSWAERTSCNGTATIRCLPRWSNFNPWRLHCGESMDMPSDVLDRWKRDYVLWAEIFALLNLAFLSVDIYTAHSANSFLRRPEYVPLVFSILATITLIIALWFRKFRRGMRLWRWTGFI